MKKLIACLMVFGMAVSMAGAEILFDSTSSSGTDYKTWFISDLNSLTQHVAGVNASGISAGLIEGHGLVADDESFAFTADGVYGWTTSGASAAISNGTFLTYLNSLADVGIGSLSGGDICPDSRSEDPNDGADTFAANSVAAYTPEAVVFSFDTAGLAPTTRLIIKSIPVSLWTSGDRSDVLVYDDSAGTVSAWLPNGNYGDPIDNIEGVIGGPLVMENGDLLIIGVGASSVDQTWRLSGGITFEVDSVLPPFYGAHRPVPGDDNQGDVKKYNRRDIRADISGSMYGKIVTEVLK